MNVQPHIRLNSDIDVDSAIIVGDPARVDLILTMMSNFQFLTYNREYKSSIGIYQNKKILVLSTGIGAPSTAIAIEELNNIGIKKIIRVGSAGA
ncbi:nucleoside phosphorylase, partial [Escherichia coli]|uniref:phosphorylase family protein n=2 Tax=Bacteria TaxID=2 RepID=UPI0013661CAB|nr:nucleoside phosphorylase [Escherichia coli]